MPSSTFRSFFTLMVPCLLLTGCASSGLVTGLDDRTRSGTQSETDATTSFVNGVHRIVVGFNDDTSQTAIQYGPTSRKVTSGASMMGWSYSEDNGVTWHYGGRLSPPPGWAALWGDPALTTSRSQYNLVFLSNLAIPESKLPAGGTSGGLDGATLGGACIARSTDGGVRFTNFQCVTNTTRQSRGDFYDGGSMASSMSGEIYASYVDIDRAQIDIWRSPDGRQPFALLPPPFPNYYIGSHPRIRVGTDGTLYAMALAQASSGDSIGALVGNRYRNGTWGDPKVILGGVPIYPKVDFANSVLGLPLTLRTGPQFSFDFGARSAGFDDSIRWLVTQRNDQDWLFVRGGVCDEQLSDCFFLDPWTFPSQGPGARQRIDVFNPNVAAFPGLIFAIAPRWEASFLTRYGNSSTTINVTRATLGYLESEDQPAKPFSIPVDIARNALVCPDHRPTSHGDYWGDYDGFLSVQVDGDRVRFLRLMTDSSLGCTKRWSYVGEQQHVRAVSYWN
jgi:hypothetical protein